MTTSLATRFPHRLDDRVSFHELGHWYEHNETSFRVPKSQTEATGVYFDTFDPDAIVDRYYASWKSNKESKYWPLIHFLKLAQGKDDNAIKGAIKQLWRLNGLEACEAGTKMHREIEMHLEGLSSKEFCSVHLPLLTQFLQSFKPEEDLEPWRVEFVVCVEVEVEVIVDEKVTKVTRPAVAGSIDAIFRSKKDGRFWIIDWKRVDPRGGLIGNPVGKKHRSACMAKSPFDEWEASNYNKYSAQLLGYQWQLVAGGYMQREEIAGAFIVQMHEDLERVHVVQVADMWEVVDIVMSGEVDAAKNSYITPILQG